MFRTLPKMMQNDSAQKITVDVIKGVPCNADNVLDSIVAGASNRNTNTYHYDDSVCPVSANDAAEIDVTVVTHVDENNITGITYVMENTVTPVKVDLQRLANQFSESQNWLSEDVISTLSKRNFVPLDSTADLQKTMVTDIMATTQNEKVNALLLHFKSKLTKTNPDLIDNIRENVLNHRVLTTPLVEPEPITILNIDMEASILTFEHDILTSFFSIFDTNYLVDLIPTIAFDTPKALILCLFLGLTSFFTKLSFFTFFIKTENALKNYIALILNEIINNRQRIEGVRQIQNGELFWNPSLFTRLSRYINPEVKRQLSIFMPVGIGLGLYHNKDSILKFCSNFIETVCTMEVVGGALKAFKKDPIGFISRTMFRWWQGTSFFKWFEPKKFLDWVFKTVFKTNFFTKKK